MARKSNLLHEVFQKSWKLQEEQLGKILSQAGSFHDWLQPIVPAAKEAIHSNVACSLPGAPSVKRHKLNEPEPDQCDEIFSNEENEISDDKQCKLTEAKRPRKLRRSTKGSKPSVSRSRTSKRSSTKAKAVAVKSASRVTRSAAKDTTLNESTIFIESSLHSIHEAGSSDGHSDDLQSNTTKSFIEHEADFCLSGNKKSDSTNFNKEVPSSMKNSDDSVIPRNSIQIVASKEAIIEEKDAAHSSKEMLSGNEIIRDVDMVDDANQQTNQCKVRLERLSAAEIENKCETEQDHVGVNNCENMSNQETEKLMALEKQTIVCESPSNLVPGVQIAKIKERLFEKIKVPASSTPKAQSPRRGRSPLRGGNCNPRKENSPASKGRKIEKVIVSDQIDNSEDVIVDEKKMEVFISTDCDPIKEVESSENKDSNGEEFDNDSDGCYERKGPKIVKPVKPKNIVSGVHSLIQAANQNNNVINQAPYTKKGNIVVGITSFIKSNTETKTETVQERKKRIEEEVRKREQVRKKLVEQAELRRQQEIDERKKRRQEREQRVAEAQAKKAQEDVAKIKITQEKLELMKKKEERVRKYKEKEEEMKRKMRERKMAEAEAKRRNEELERKAKLAEKEEEDKKRAEFLQRKQEYEEVERKKKIEEQKRLEEQRLECHQRDLQLQEERIRREIEEREALVRKRLEEKAQREKEERELKEQQEKKRLEKERQEREEQESLRKEAEELERARKEAEAKLKKERELKEAKEQEMKEREAYYKKKLEQKQLGEVKRTFDKAELDIKESVMKSPAHPAPHLNKTAQNQVQKVHCTSYKTPTLNKVKSKLHKKRSPSLQSYDIEDLNEDDSTDDEEDPAQMVPSWAKGANLTESVRQQQRSDIDPYEIFANLLQPPKLEEIFPKLRARFFKRTSSACWDHPPRPAKTVL
ncbi:inner centromere protein A-like [Rhopilema esculentum]|uniref:inner centromere protein A-like n=1 Tax=Rhopilema esculentum TaxID=499914 RepID=UPI0031D4E960